MALWLIGLGLHDATDVTVKGLERIRSCDVVYVEFYTAILGGTDHAGLESFLGRSVEHLPRAGVEAGGRNLVSEAANADVALLTAGDPMAATTHTELVLRAREAGVPVHIIHAPSIYSAAPGLLGLQHYKFGRTTTLVRPEPNWMPTSPFDAVAENRSAGLHTLVLLDIKAEESPAYFMSANEAIDVLRQLSKLVGADWFTDDTPVGVVARAGSETPGLWTGTIGTMAHHDFGAPLHCVVLPGTLQVIEQEAWDSLAV